MPDRSQKRIYWVHWAKSWENFWTILYFSRNFPIFFLKWANSSPILRKNGKISGKNTKLCRNFPAIFPSVLDSLLSKMETTAQYKLSSQKRNLSYAHCGRLWRVSKTLQTVVNIAFVLSCKLLGIFSIISMLVSTLTEIIGKFGEKYRRLSPVFSRWECFCQNWRIIRQFWQKYSHFEKIGEGFLSFSSNFLMIFVSVDLENRK